MTQIVGKEVTIDNFKFDPTIDSKTLHEQLNAAIKEKANETKSEETKSEETSSDKVESESEIELSKDIDQKVIQDGFKNLSDEEKEAVIEFYGKFNKDDKVFKYLQSLKK